VTEGAGTELADLHHRLQGLEARHHALRRFAILTVAGLTIAVVALGWLVVRNNRSARFKTVEAEHFVVRDSLDQWRGELGMYYGTIVRLTLGPDDRTTRGIAIGLGPSHKPLLVLRSGDDGPAVRLTPRAVGLDQHFGQADGAEFYLERGVPSLQVIDSGGRRIYRDSLRLRR